MAAYRYSAAREVAHKSEAQIERETARKWSSRARACYRRYAATGELRWLLEGEQWRHEALEHAAGAHDGGKLVGELERVIEKVRPKITRAR